MVAAFSGMHAPPPPGGGDPITRRVEGHGMVCGIHSMHYAQPVDFFL